MNIHDLKGERMAFAASGGLDSCTIVHWLSANGVKVVCMTADLGQPDETSFDEIGKRMLASGADEFIGMPLQETLSEIGLAIVQAQADQALTLQRRKDILTSLSVESSAHILA